MTGLITILYVSLDSVADTPTMVIASRTASDNVVVAWNNQSQADGYEVFCQVDSCDIISRGTTTNTELTLTGVSLHELSCFVVAYGDINTIPSARSSVVNVQAVLQLCTPAINSQGVIVPNADLPTQGIAISLC